MRKKIGIALLVLVCLMTYRFTSSLALEEEVLLTDKSKEYVLVRQSKEWHRLSIICGGKTIYEITPIYFTDCGTPQFLNQ